MKSKYLKIVWKDPVLSQTIAVLIITIITFVYGIFNSLITKKSFSDELVSIWTYKVSLWIILLMLVTIYLTIHFARKRFRYDIETLMLDRNLFDSIRNRPMMTEFTLEMKSNGFSSRPVSMDVVGAMIDFLEASKKPEFEFFNPKLDKLKRTLINVTQELDVITSNYVCGTNAAGWVALPSEWEYNDLSKLNEAKSTIQPLENKFTEAYQEFVSQGRRILKV